MSGLTLRLDIDRWRSHLAAVAAATPGLVPVAKGNGYGFGLARLAAESSRLGVDTIAVGLASEVAAVRDHFPGDIVIMTPWRADDDRARTLLSDPRVITTVSGVEDLATIVSLGADAGPKPRVIIEVITSMLRHGIPPDDLAVVGDLLDRISLQGWMIHLPLLESGRSAEAERLGRAALGVAPAPLWISHLPVIEATAVADRLAHPGEPPVPVRLRVGTGLWLGAPGAWTAVATVLDVHPVRRGDRAGYRQRKINQDGWLVILAGGTAHGVGLEAPTPAATGRQRLVALAQGGLEATGRALSPYTIGGKKRWFLEPPHMQTSLVLLPASVPPPKVGDDVPVELRLTTAVVDQVVEV
ncbi:MAG TPA: alanine racemase [Microlunatus sp.]|nr:alanine racemase [Microlunatus sp.]